MEKTIYVDWNDEESIKKANKLKFEYENKGYKLIDTYNFCSISTTLIYIN